MKMYYGIVDRKNHKTYTHLGNVFSALDGIEKDYNWLISDTECVPNIKEYEELFAKEYCWLSGKELSEIVKKDDFQWIWGVLCAFEKDVSLEEALSYPLPLARDYNGYFQNPVSLQHPLSTLEIFAFDSSYTIIISKDKAIIDGYLRHLPKCEDLFEFNK